MVKLYAGGLFVFWLVATYVYPPYATTSPTWYSVADVQVSSYLNDEIYSTIEPRVGSKVAGDVWPVITLYCVLPYLNTSFILYQLDATQSPLLDMPSVCNDQLAVKSLL